MLFGSRHKTMLNVCLTVRLLILRPLHLNMVPLGMMITLNVWTSHGTAFYMHLIDEIPYTIMHA